MPTGSYWNTILQRLDDNIIERLNLHAVQLPRNQTLELPGDEIRHLYFIESGVGSMTTTFLNGTQVEVGLFGWESVVGVSMLMGTRHSLNHIFMQVAGHGYTTTRDRAIAEFKRGGEFQRLALRYVQAQLVQTAQSAGCNARHSAEHRLARWLLLCHDRCPSGQIDLTQDFLSMMIGTSRPALSVVAAKLQDRGMIEYTRGKVTILNRRGLEKAACECYAVVRNHLDNYAVSNEGLG